MVTFAVAAAPTGTFVKLFETREPTANRSLLVPVPPTADMAAGDVFISEYIEGTSNNKAIEIYNGTGASVDLAAGSYVLQLYSNGAAAPSASLNLTATIANGDVLVLAHPSANPTILAQADVTSSAVINFNGDDAVVLRKGGGAGVIVDAFGQVGFDPGTNWGTGLTSTLDHTLTRKSTVCAGDTNGADAFDPATEWNGFAVDTFTNLGSHSATCGFSATYSIDDVTHSEGNSPDTTTYTFTVTRSATGSASSVGFQTVDGTATVAGGDFVTGSGTLNFAAADMSLPVAVTVNGDNTAEPDENFVVHLLNPSSGTTIANGDGTGTIVNDDGGPAITYVDDDWAAVVPGTDPDGMGPAANFGFDSFATVQGGINGVAVGGTVNVRAGTYNESQVLIAKAVSVVGAGTATTTINGGNTAIGSAGLVRIDLPLTETGNASFTGFTVTNAGLTGGSRYHMFAKAAATEPTITISNNKLVGGNGSDYGIYSDRPRGTVIFDHNEITNIAFNPILIERPTGSTDFHDNIVTGNGSTAYFNFTYGGQDVLTLQRVANNSFNGSSASCIAVNSSSNIGGGLGKYTNVAITGNTIAQLAATRIGINLSNTAAAGSGAVGAIENPAITGNTITGTNAATSKGIRLNGQVVNATITQNDIRNLDRGISGEVFNSHSANGTEVHFNHVVGNTTGIFWDGGSAANTENNWWGCNFGPGQGGTGCTGTANGLGGANVASVDANPWIVLGASALPATIAPGGTSDITASMKLNSDGGTPSVSTFVPSVGVAFTATEGNIAPPAGTITSGEAAAVFTSTSANNGSASTKVDSQTATAPITVSGTVFSIDDVTHSEGDAGTTSYTFTVTKTGTTGLSSMVAFETADGSATVAGNDYQSNSGTLTFGPTDTAKQITVLVNGDTAVEGDENFFVNLTEVSNGSIGDGQGQGTIVTDDFAPLFLSISDARVAEGDEILGRPQGGLTDMIFTVTLSGGAPNLIPVTVHYHTSDGTATGMGEDYVPEQNGIIQIGGGGNRGAGNTETATLIVRVIPDTNLEANEFLYVTLDQAEGATITRATGTGIIVDEDRAYVGDMDNDKKTDLTVFRPDNAVWYTLPSATSVPVYSSFGISADEPVVGDYDGDGHADLAVRRPGTDNQWWYQFSSDLSLNEHDFGYDGDVSVQADYDGDGKTDLAVFRNGSWFILQSSTNTLRAVYFGTTGDLPVTGDFDGDAKADICVFRAGTWYLIRSSDNATVTQQFGVAGDTPIAGDFDGDGRFDFSVIRGGGTWYVLETLSGSMRTEFWGVAGDVPVVGDYDGDGTSDVAVFRPSDGNWYVLRSSDHAVSATHWGQSGDVPVPATYLP